MKTLNSARGRVAFVVLGCAKNQVEAESMSSRLAAEGWELTADIPGASVVVVHSCGFLGEAREEAQATLRRVRRAAPRAFVVLTGCFAQYLNGKAYPGVDALLGTGQFDRLPELIARRAPGPNASAPSGYHDPSRPRPLRPGQKSAYLRISEGCNHRCTFCVIPQLRGNLKSRDPQDIFAEGRGLVERGIQELVLISQDTTAYGEDRPGMNLPDILRELSSWPETRWLRMLYAYPSEVNDELIDLLAGDPKLCGYLDMPLQHFSDRMLKAMARNWGQKQTAALLEKLAKRVPGLALRTTFIVGFPGETEKDFQEILAVVRAGYFEHVGVFPYSFEERSPSARMDDQVPTEIAAERWQRLLDEHETQKTKRDAGRRGKTLEILVETGPDGKRYARARHQAPEVDGVVELDRLPETSGFYRARVTGIEGINLTAKVTPLPGPPASAPLAPQVPGALRPAPQGGRENQP